jgi:L-alanine-DL-glutamate epimerase-like enolase superfamily enzyme
MQIERIECLVFRAPVATPVRTSFGTMHHRPAVLVRVTDRDGAEGWGEIWCNFPSVGAEHRARLLRDVVGPVAVAEAFAGPADLYERLTRHFAVLAIQTGEHGPLAQVIAGLDIAVWDLAARRAGVPLHVHLGAAQKLGSVAAYASGLNPDQPEKLAATKQAQGYRAFKLKVGFGEARDLQNLANLRAELGDAVRLMADANQGWDGATAIRMSGLMEAHRLDWLEEPIRADRPLAEWSAFVAASPIPIAAGENMRNDDFEDAMEAGFLGVLQPDLGKWGGFSRCVGIGRAALARSIRFCPHWLGGGVGLLASAHLLAAVGGDGMVEVDSNPNPLRDEMFDVPWKVDGGHLSIPDGPGLGAVPDLAAIARHQVPF